MKKKRRKKKKTAKCPVVLINQQNLSGWSEQLGAGQIFTRMTAARFKGPSRLTGPPESSPSALRKGVFARVHARVCVCVGAAQVTVAESDWIYTCSLQQAGQHIHLLLPTSLLPVSRRLPLLRDRLCFSSFPPPHPERPPPSLSIWLIVANMKRRRRRKEKP